MNREEICTYDYAVGSSTAWSTKRYGYKVLASPPSSVSVIIDGRHHFVFSYVPLRPSIVLINASYKSKPCVLFHYAHAVERFAKGPCQDAGHVLDFIHFAALTWQRS
jgi:hypothetical protein